MDDRADSGANLMKGGAIVAATFALTLLIYFTCVRFMDSAKGRFRPVSRLASANGSEAPPRQTPGYSPLAPTTLPPRITGGYTSTSGATSGVPYFANPPAPARTVVPPGLNPGQLYFSDAAARTAAQNAVRSLRMTLDSIRKYDSRSFWQSLPEVSGPAMMAQGQSQEVRPAGERIYTTDPQDDARKRAEAMTRVLNETEALATELALVAHPDQFPPELRETAQRVGSEARIYLSTVQTALHRPGDRNELQGLAQKHLAASESLLKNMERSVGLL